MAPHYKKRKPKINYTLCFVFFIKYLVGCAVPLFLSYIMAYITANIDNECTFEQMFEDQLENGLLYGVITLLLTAILSYFLFRQKIDDTWRTSTKNFAAAIAFLSVIVLLFLFGSLLILPLGSAYSRICPSARVVFSAECIAILFCVILQCITHPDAFLA